MTHRVQIIQFGPVKRFSYFQGSHQFGRKFSIRPKAYRVIVMAPNEAALIGNPVKYIFCRIKQTEQKEVS